jgi:hypothetical protein
MPCAGCDAAAGRLAESVAGQVQWRDSKGVERIRQESLSLLRDGSSVLRQRGEKELTTFPCLLWLSSTTIGLLQEAGCTNSSQQAGTTVSRACTPSRAAR